MDRDRSRLEATLQSNSTLEGSIPSALCTFEGTGVSKSEACPTCHETGIKEGAPIAVTQLTGTPLPRDAEFTPGATADVFNGCGLGLGRCLGSKSGYIKSKSKRHLPVCFNANVFSLKHGKVWWGDLDINEDAARLETVARRLRRRLYVLREFDGRFERAVLPRDEIVRRAVWHTGGPAMVSGVARFLRVSGLSIKETSTVARLALGRLTRRQRPDIRLEVHRRLVELSDVFGRVGLALGCRPWGRWWTSPHEKLDRKSPLRHLLDGGVLDLKDLFGQDLAWDALKLALLFHRRL